MMMSGIKNPLRSCRGDPAEELEGLRGHFPREGRDSVPEQELPAHPGRAVGPPHPQDPHQHPAGRGSAGLLIYILNLEPV